MSALTVAIATPSFTMPAGAVSGIDTLGAITFSKQEKPATQDTRIDNHQYQGLNQPVIWRNHQKY